MKSGIRVLGVSVTALVLVFVLASCADTRTQTRGTGLLDSRDPVRKSEPAYAEEKADFNDSEDLTFEEEPVKDTVKKSKVVKAPETVVRPHAAVAKPLPAKKVPAAPVQEENTKFNDEDTESVDLNEDVLPAKIDTEMEIYDQTGPASWYGREFQGKKTASGEKFDMYEMTAAHKTLPLGSIVEVTSLDTGKSVKVKINDRGPYKGARIIDLSYAAGRELGILAKGEAMVGIRVISKGSGDVAKTPKKTALKPAGGAVTPQPKITSIDDPAVVHDTGDYSVQAGAFYTRKNAEKIKEKIESVTGGDVVIIEESDMFKVRIINLGTKQDASRIKRDLEKADMPGIIIEK